jgi:serine/threonine protein kinase
MLCFSLSRCACLHVPLLFADTRDYPVAMDAYTVEKPIGAGNYGEVVLVRHNKSGQTFVCKKVNLANKNPQQQKESENEVRTMSKVKHPNIVGFIDAFVEKRVLHIVMEYADGSDLEKFLLDTIKRKVVVPEERIIAIFTQIALALRQLHKQHLLHRDLKSANVFLTAAGEVKLGDFGFSKQLTYTMALASTICGTPYYFSPELCQKLPYNNKSDVWSLGVILYELINLRKPFEARNLPELRKRVVTEEPAPFNAPHVSEDLKQLCLSMLRKSSSTRPSVEQVLQSSIIRAHMARMSAEFEKQGQEARERAQQIKTEHPPDAHSGETPKAQPASMANHALKTGKWNPAEMKALMQTGDTTALMAPKVRPAEEAAEPAERLHSRPMPDSRSQVSSKAPVSVVSELSNAAIREENSKFMKDEVEGLLANTEPTDTEVFEAIGEAQSDDEAQLRNALGEVVFMKALQLMILINSEGGTTAAEKHYSELLQLLGDKSYLVGDLQRVSAQFEAA